MAPVAVATGADLPAGIVGEVHAAVVASDPLEWGRLCPAEQRERMVRLARERAPLLDDATLVDIVEHVQARISGLGPLDPLLADPALTEVMVNGDGRVWFERRGRLCTTDIRLDEATVLHLIERIVAPLGRRIDRASPVVDARLPDGSRVNAIVRPVAVDGPCLTIRRFGARALPISAFAGSGVESLLQWAVAARWNIVVSGGTGSGKTTLLNALAGLVPSGTRLITIEDTAELRLAADHVVRLEARGSNGDGVGAFSIRDLVRNALRMRPDLIVVGEVRGDEALDMLQAMNTGHEGSMSTVHANSPDDALRRIETMVMMGAADLPLPAVRAQVASAVDLVVHVARTSDGSRRVDAIAEVTGVASDDGFATHPLVLDGRVAAGPARAARRRDHGSFDLQWVGR
jgi:pilus assembly protein CpaF